METKVAVKHNTSGCSFILDNYCWALTSIDELSHVGLRLTELLAHTSMGGGRE